MLRATIFLELCIIFICLVFSVLSSLSHEIVEAAIQGANQGDNQGFNQGNNQGFNQGHGKKNGETVSIPQANAQAISYSSKFDNQLESQSHSTYFENPGNVQSTEGLHHLYQPSDSYSIANEESEQISETPNRPPVQIPDHEFDDDADFDFIRSTQQQSTGLGLKSLFVDTSPPVLVVPSIVRAVATNPQGAMVSFNVGTYDNADPFLIPICSSASGSTFPIGSTFVTCSATDLAGNLGSASFTVIVDPPLKAAFLPN